MKVSKEEILHIANLASLNLKEDEIEEYAINLKEILEFSEVINSANVEELEETGTIKESYNVFRKDEVVDFRDIDALLQNSPDTENKMFRIPKVI